MYIQINTYTGSIIYLGHTVSDVNDLSKKERAHKPRILQHAKKKQFRDRSMKQDSHHGQSGREAMVWSGQFWYMVGK